MSENVLQVKKYTLIADTELMIALLIQTLEFS